MKVQYFLSDLLFFLRKNWFRVSVAALLLYLFFQRDLSVQFQVNAPSAEPSHVNTTQFEIPEAVPTPSPDKLGLLFAETNEKTTSLQDELHKLAAYEIDAFIQRFVDVARVEQDKFGIPASVILATALYQSTAGHRKIADVHHNNYFGLLCADPSAYTPAWQGSCQKIDHTLFRKYQTAWESFRDFSYFTHKQLSNLKGEDYRVWVEALGRKVYGKDPNFAATTIALVEQYNLHDYDF